MKSLKEWDEFLLLMQSEEHFVVFKHSDRCGISSRAYREVRSYIQNDGKLSVYLVDVIENRSLSQRIAQELGTRHESPQVIFINQGKPGLVLSHYSVKAKTLIEQSNLS